MIYIGQYVDENVSENELVKGRENFKKMRKDKIKKIFNTIVVYKIDKLICLRHTIRPLSYFQDENVKIRVISCKKEEEIDSGTCSPFEILTFNTAASTIHYQKALEKQQRDNLRAQN